MYKTKKEVDAHVRVALSKLRNDNDRNLRGFAIAKLYYKVNDFVSAEQFLLSYLKVHEDNDQAYKLLGQCYQRLKKPDKALQAYQRSLQLNGKQADILVEVCQLLLDEPEFNANKARYWCELAESEKVQHDAVFTLRLKMVNKGNLQTDQLEELIHKEIAARPKDVQLRVRLLRTYLEQNRILDAFGYVCKLQHSQEDDFVNSAEWHNVVWLVLSKYEQMPNMKRDWEFWLLIVSCLERQLVLSFNLTASSGCTEIANLLFQLDQYLHKMAQLSDKFSGVQNELVNVCLNHYRGQFLLHATSLLYKRELMQNKNMWKETVKTSLPLLFLAYQVEPPENKQPWMKHCNEQGKKLLQLWHREGSFRCAQAARTILSCVVDEENFTSKKENASQQANNLLIGGTTSAQLWNKNDDLLAQVRQSCADKQWRHQVFNLLFCNSDQRMKEQFSMFVKTATLAEPRYNFPNYEDLERYEETAQLLQPNSLEHMVYLSLGSINSLMHMRAHYFSGMNFSTQNLAFCGAESLNRLDIETFLYATVLQSNRQLEVERDMLESYQSGNRNAVGRPRLLPFVNVQSQLCTEEQAFWWQAAYQVYKNLYGENLAEIRAKLQHGIEAVRGINGTKIDLLIVFKLGKIFVQRAQDAVKPVEKAFLEARAENLYKHGLNMLKLHQKGVLEPFHKLFKYAKSNCSAVEREVVKAAEDAVSYLAAQYFKKSEYEEFIDDFNGLQLPFATYMQAEAYRRLEETDKTPKKGRRVYLDRAYDCLNQTLALLKSAQTDPDHPLNTVLQTEMKCLHQAFGKYMFNDNTTSYIPANGNNSSTYEDAEADSFGGDLPTVHTTPGRRLSHTRRESLGLSTSLMRNSEMEQLIKDMVGTLSFLKDELTENIKPELLSMRKEIGSLNDKIANMENTMKKSQANNVAVQPITEDAAQVLDDLYIIEDALQNQIFTPNTPINSNSAVFANQSNSPFISQNQQQPARLQTPNAMQMQQNAAAVAAAAYAANPMFNPNYAAMAYYSQSPYMMAAQQGGAASSAILGTRNPLAAMPYMPDNLNGMNFNMTSSASLLPPTQSMPMNQQQDNMRSSTSSVGNNLYGLLTQSSNNQLPQLSLLLPTMQPIVPPVAQTTSNIAAMATTPVASATAAASTPPVATTGASTVAAPFNKALNNKPVEKLPPANVVITSSDPLPNPSSAVMQSQQPPLSVTIPPHHIKYSTVGAAPPVSDTPSSTLFSGFDSNISSNSNTFGSSTFSFKPQVEQALKAALNNNPLDEAGNDSSDSVGDVEAEYDPQPDFKPIIPLPDKIEVKTGEEDEEIKFSSRAKLYRHVDGEWKERGTGDIKILKHSDGHSRILMRREQTFKICANHQINSTLKLTTPPNEAKGFVWAANDFADGELKLEKFFIRFKLPATAQEFKKSFEEAVNDAGKLEKKQKKLEVVSSVPAPTFGLSKSSTINSFATSTPAGKTDFSKPPAPAAAGVVSSSATTNNKNSTLFANLNLVSKTTKGSAEPSQTVSPFANFSFSNSGNTAATPTGSTASPFANIFGNFDKSGGSAAFPTIGSLNKDKQDANVSSSTEAPLANRSNVSETEDDYVPTAQFKPVIPLPDLVELNTGEENEIVLFEYRAKLLRFEKATSEWKERGLGKIKLLRHKNDVNMLRLVMRREQVHKLCCNQRIYKDTKFMLANTASRNAVTWTGPDYSENELVTETLTLRFKTAETTQDFLTAVKKAQEAMTADGEENLAKNVEQNQLSQLKEDHKVLPEKGFGNEFKPKAGSWSCQACYTSNMGDNLYCVACENPKDDSVPKKPQQSSVNLSTGSSFTFGFNSNANKSIIKTPTFENSETTNISDVSNTKSSATASNSVGEKGFGDAFKPKLGSWTCEACYLSNGADTLYCNACSAPKDNTVPNKEPEGLNLSSNAAPKFSFGFGAKNATPNNSAPLVFGQNKENNDGIKSFNFGGLAAATTTVTPTLGKSTFSFSMAMPSIGSTTSTTNSNVVTSTAMTPFSLDKKEFSFTMKPKSPGNKANRSAGGDTDLINEDADESVDNEEEDNTYFTPAIPLPDKIEVKTGEEDEEVLYVHRAKLFRYVDGEWKERGLGDVKILRHKKTQKLRVVMRRDQILKICLNHVLNADVEYKAKDEKSWLFVVNDFSEGEFELQKFSLRFKTKEIAQGFVDAVNKALAGTMESNAETAKPTASDLHNNNVNISEENKQLADKLKLPHSLYATTSVCDGCRGCDDDKFEFETPATANFVNEQDNDQQTELPLQLPPLKLPKGNTNNLLLKQSVLKPTTQTNATDNTNNNSKTSTSFSFIAAAKENEAPASSFVFGGNTSTSASGGSLFSSSALTNSSGALAQKPSIFGNALNKSDNSATAEQPISIFGGTGSGSSIFGNKTTFDLSGNQNKTNIFGGALNTSTNAGDGKPRFSFDLTTSSFINKEKQQESEEKPKPTPMSTFSFGSAAGGLDFASLAKAYQTEPLENSFSKPENKSGEPIKFVGLTNENAFLNFQQKKENDDSVNNNSKQQNSNCSIQSVEGDSVESYDPFYAPIIELPKEIVVSTGEENETKLFGERATLYRFDAKLKEWKERGVGELKILQHNEKRTVRLLLRREQVQKLVLNHAIGGDFLFNNFNNNPKSFAWAAMNYAENTEGEMEQLAVRFKKLELAQQFSKIINDCIANAKLQKD